MLNAYVLSNMQANLVKDVLKVIGRDDTLNKQFAQALGLTPFCFNRIADNAFNNLGNGRVTFETEKEK